MSKGTGTRCWRCSDTGKRHSHHRGCGYAVSFDPVALDVACADAVNQQPLLANTWLTDLPTCDHEDHFIGAHPETDWHSQVEHGEKIGIGQRNYELIFVK